MALVYIVARIASRSRPTITSSFDLVRNLSGQTVGSTVFVADHPAIYATGGGLSTVTLSPAGSGGTAPGGLGIGKQFQDATKALTASNYLSCGMCPDSLVNLISDEVREVSAMVLRVKRITILLNKVTEGAEQAALELINGFIDLIPYPPLLDLRQIVATLMCPLLPQAWVIQSYQKGIVSANKLASNTVPFGSLNPAYYPVLISATAKFTLRAGVDILDGALNAVWAVLKQWVAQWKQMAKELWRRFIEYIDTQNPFTEFGSGGNSSAGGTVNRQTTSSSTFAKSVGQVASLAEVSNPVEGMMVYIEQKVNLQKFQGYDRRPSEGTAGIPEAATYTNPMAGSRQGFGVSAEDSAAAQLAQGISYTRTRYVYRNNTWVALSDSAIKKFLKLLFRVLMEFWSVVRNIGYFTVRASVTKASVALVRATCPAVYNSPSYPFMAYDVLTKDFKMQGFVPSGLGTSAKPFVDAGMRLFLKIESWTASAYIVAV